MKVNMYPDSNGAGEKPIGFVFDGRKILIDEVIDQWHDGQHQYLRLLANDERIYFLKHGEGSFWEVERIYGY